METLYIFGIHLGRGKKERVWRAPNKFQKEWEDILNIGDIVMVKTKRGNAPIEVTRIERLDKCPVDISVKRVVEKISRYNKENDK